MTFSQFHFFIMNSEKMSFDFKYNYPQIARDSGFKLRQYRDGHLDWRLVGINLYLTVKFCFISKFVENIRCHLSGSLEVERILREQQFEHIDAILYYLSEAPLASMLESNILDSGISKYFILSQLAIQYLIFCRKFLDESVRTLRESLVEAEVENVNLKTANQGHSNEILQLHKKISQMEAINEIVFPCHMCTKNFVSNDALNIHLLKKHSKIPAADIQGKENDRTLINTIKLELEIKQLKERLNIAEKDIRETVENKKESPREGVKISSSTQIKTPTIDVGIQNNLFETKENDSTKDERDDKSEIISQLEEKISKLETWQETQRIDSQQSLNDITEKLSKIADSVQLRSEHDDEIFKKLTKEAILLSTSSQQIIPTSSTDDLQTILNNTVSKALQINSEKFNEILTKIETINAKKVPPIEGEIHKGRILAQEQMATSLPLVAPTFPSNMEEYPSDEKDSLTQHTPRTYSIEKYSPIHDSYETQSDGTSTNVSPDLSESKENVDESINSTLNNIEAALPNKNFPKKVNIDFEKTMALYGINLNAKAISVSEADRVLSRLSENRSSLQKIYPRFYATRNKLKNFVGRLSSKKQTDENSRIIKSHTASLENSRDIKPKDNHNESLFKEREPKNDEFKKRLEKILTSPIKKPSTYVRNRVPDSTKPIPMPRKRVMFYDADERRTVNEVLHSLQRSKSAVRES